VVDEFKCPGCGKDVSAFMTHDAHFADEVDLRVQNGNQRPPWPWTDSKNRHQSTGQVCAWTRDFLAAEWLRRHPQPWVYS
jgi:hypothetical protein